MTNATDSTTPQAFQFGDSPQLADRLVALVIAGRKTASCFAAVHADKVTAPGERWVALCGAGQPVAVIETLEMRRVRFSEVTPEMAALEGEGDLSHAFWADGHETFFRREGTWAPDMELCFEIFRLVEVLDYGFADTVNAHVAEEIAKAAARGYGQARS